MDEKKPESTTPESQALVREDFSPEIRQALGSYLSQAQAEIHRLDSEFCERFADAVWPHGVRLIESYCLERFDLIASLLIVTSKSDSQASINPLYEKYLDQLKEKSLKNLSTVLSPVRADIREDVFSRNALKLEGRKRKWLASAYAAKDRLGSGVTLVGSTNLVQREQSTGATMGDSEPNIVTRSSAEPKEEESRGPAKPSLVWEDVRHLSAIRVKMRRQLSFAARARLGTT